MLVKILKHGTGSGREAIKYLLDEFDHKKVRRAGVEVLRGDPFLIGQLIDSLKFKHRYTSVVIAWQPGDRLSRQQIEQVLDVFDVTARSGLAPVRLGSCAILHTDRNGGQHVHILIARVDLQTGKSFNLAPPGWQTTFDRFCDYFNSLYGWANPAIPSTSSIEGLDPDEPESLAPATLIERRLLKRIRSGLISNRGQLMAGLSRLGKINWDGHRFIKFRPHGFEKAITLKGAIFAKNCDFERVAGVLRSEFSSLSRIGEPDADRARVALVELSERICERAKFNSSRYGANIGGRPANFEDSELQKFARNPRRSPLPSIPRREGVSTNISEALATAAGGGNTLLEESAATTSVEVTQNVGPGEAEGPQFS